jgi:hypothetical protein
MSFTDVETLLSGGSLSTDMRIAYYSTERLVLLGNGPNHNPDFVARRGRVSVCSSQCAWSKRPRSPATYRTKVAGPDRKTCSHFALRGEPRCLRLTMFRASCLLRSLVGPRAPATPMIRMGVTFNVTPAASSPRRPDNSTCPKARGLSNSLMRTPSIVQVTGGRNECIQTSPNVQAVLITEGGPRAATGGIASADFSTPKECLGNGCRSRQRMILAVRRVSRSAASSGRTIKC